MVNLDAYDDDVSYVRDLGLNSPRNPVRVANPIYREVIARVLTDGVEAVVFADPRSFVLPAAVPLATTAATAMVG